MSNESFGFPPFRLGHLAF